MDLRTLTRNYGFWFYDRLKSGRIAWHYNDLKKSLTFGQQGFSFSDTPHRSFLEHTWQNTVFYKKFKGLYDLSKYPIVSRDMINRNPELFKAEIGLNSKIKQAVTSGSTGVPFYYPMTEDKWARRMAEIIYYNELAGYRIGMKHVDVINKNKHKLVLFFQNAVQLDSKTIDEQWLAAARKILLFNDDIKIIISFVSTMELFAAYCLSQNDDPSAFGFHSVILKGEPLNEPSRELIKKVFNCKVYSRYASEEFGVLAQSFEEGNCYHLNTSSYYIEILSIEEDKPAVLGELGRIVITDHYSHVLPLIRYDIGDLTVMKNNHFCSKVAPVLENIEGRKIDMLNNVAGDYVSPFIINRLLKNIGGILQFQFIQFGRNHYKINLNVTSDYKKEDHEIRISRELKQVFGNEAVIEFTYLEEIPYSPSGKRNYIINEYARSQG